mgnify:CR=1 FL=1
MYNLLDEIRRRPGLYIGNESPNNLKSFLDGYLWGKGHNSIEESSPNFNDFHDWVAKKLGYYESTSGWANMIEDQREDKQEALYLFFELLDEFRGIEHDRLMQTTYPSNGKLDTSIMGYSRWKKTYGTYEPSPKPYPKTIAIDKIHLGKGWYSLIALDENNHTMDVRNWDDLDGVYHMAKRIYGLEESDLK